MALYQPPGKYKSAWPILQRSDPLAKGLVGAWTFHERGGDVAHDVSGQRRDGTLSGMNGADWLYAAERQCLDFDGSDDEITTAFPFISAPFTINVWLRHNTPQTTAQYLNMVTRGSVFENNTNFAFAMRTNSVASDYGLAAYWRSGATLYGTEYGAGGPGISANEWHMATMVVDANWDLTIYQDAISRATDSSNSAAGDGSQSLHIGAPSTVAGTDLRFQGQLADPTIYNRALTPNEIRDLYQQPWRMFTPPVRLPYSKTAVSANIGMALPYRPSGKYKPAWPMLQRSDPLAKGLVGAWTFHEKGGSTLHDVASHYDALVTNFTASTFWVTSEAGPAGDINAFGTTYAQPSGFGFGTGSMTLAAWVTFSTVDATNRYIAGTQNGGSDGGRYLRVGTGGFQFEVAGDSVKAVTAGTPATGTLYHMVGVKDDSRAVIELFVNGVSLGTTSTSGVAYSASLTNFTMGGRPDFPDTNNLKGAIVDVRAWGHALTSPEIRDLYLHPWRMFTPPIRLPISRELIASPPGGSVVSHYKPRLKRKPHWPVLDMTKPLAQDLHAAYLFHEGGGQIAHDLTPNHYHGTLQAGMTAADWQHADCGSHLTFSGGATDYIQATTHPTAAYPMTLAALVRRPTDATSDGILQYADNGSAHQQAINIDATGLVSAYSRGASTPAATATTSIENDGKWHWVVAVFYSLTYREIWLDGILEDTDAVSSGAINDLDFIQPGEGISGNYNGDIATALVWTKALSAREVAQFTNNPWDLFQQPMRLPMGLENAADARWFRMLVGRR